MNQKIANMKNIDQSLNIQQLVQLLGNKNGLEREKARNALVKKGKEVIRPLLKLLDHPKHIYRWEAIMTLKEIEEQGLVPIFISRLEDEESDIRWIAAEGLIKQGEDSVIPLLEVLMEKSDSVFVLVGAHHVFNKLHESKKLPNNFPYDNIMPLLISTSRAENLKISVHRILNEMNEATK